MQHLPQSSVAGESNIGQSLIETRNRAAIHFIVHSVPAVDLHDSSFVAIGTGKRSRPAERLSPVSREPLDMLWMKPMTEGMSNHLIRHHATMPGISKTAHTIHPARCLKDALP